MLSYASRALRRLRAPTTREDRNIRWLLLLTGLVGVVTGGIVTYVPIFLARLGASGVTISLLTSLPALVTILLALPAGAIASRWRRIVPVSARWFYALRFCYLAVALVAMLDPKVVPGLTVAIWALSAIPSTMANAVWYDVLAEAVSPRRRPMVNGVRWALTGLVSAISVAVFGQLLQALPSPLNYQIVFFISFLFGMANIWCYAQIEVPEREVPPPAETSLPLRTRWLQLWQPLTAGGGFLTFSLVTFFMRVGIYLPMGLWSLFWVRNMQASDAWIGWRATVENMATMVGYYCYGRIASRWHYSWVLTLATLSLSVCVSIAGLATAQTRWILFFCAFLGGFSGPGIDVSLFEWLLAVMPPDERPRYVAVNTVLVNGVAFLAPMAGAALAQRIGIPPVLFIEALCMLTCAVLSYRYGGVPSKRRKPAASLGPANNRDAPALQ